MQTFYILDQQILLGSDHAIQSLTLKNPFGLESMGCGRNQGQEIRGVSLYLRFIPKYIASRPDSQFRKVSTHPGYIHPSQCCWVVETWMLA
ncbi:hypothetical protein AUP68_07812 [Ilyonectria robusta]